jgi:hypothetical protein
MSTSGSMNHKQTQTHKDSRRKGNGLEGFRDKIKTYITHNKGSTWELIRAPDVDMRGKSTGCYLEDGCSLHL